MTHKEALEIGFTKRIVHPEESGDDNIYHYFEKKIGNLWLLITEHDDGEWYGSICNTDIVIKNAHAFLILVHLIRDYGQSKNL